MSRGLFTKEQLLYFKDNYKGISSKKLSKKMSSRFGIDFTEGQMQSYKSNHGYSSGYNTQFKKGNISVNKGKTWDEYMPKKSQQGSLRTTFKKGHTPQNKKPVGSERITRDGYTEIKTQEPDVWGLKHRIVWEKHNGDIPNNSAVLFKDSNKLNFDIDNLEMVHRGELLHLNRDGLITEYAELTEAGILFNKIRLKRSKLMNGEA